MKSNREFIKKRSEKLFSIKSVQVSIKDPLPGDLSAKSIISRALEKIPKHLLTNLDVIYIGQFKELAKRELHALYKDASIFASNEHSSEESMIDDIVHEVAHSVEETFTGLIYSDLEIEKEFLNKRNLLWKILKNQGFNMDLSFYQEVSYNYEFDEFLYKEVGYPKLATHTVNLFHSPYAATSLREYFADGFEAFFMKEDLPRLKKVSPKLFNKLVELLNLQEKFEK